MSTIATFPHGRTATIGVTLAACSGKCEELEVWCENCSRVAGGPGTVAVKLPLRVTKRGELPE